jgi:CRISPR-associated protein Csb2
VDVTVAVHFPHRQYHGTPWDQAANSGVVEWPPSPWRLARALLSVWHTRHPDLDAGLVESLIKVFGGPAEYRVPASASGHTRHYLPLLDHKSGESGGTTLTLDAYAGVSPTEPLLITWRGVALTDDELATASALWASLPYLGRAESICRAELREGVPDAADTQRWRPHRGGGQRLLCVADDATLGQLQVTPTAMRKGRSLMPEGAQWVDYESGEPPVRTPAPLPDSPLIKVARWRLVGAAPFPETLGLWATDRLRFLTLKPVGISDDPAVRALHGHVDHGDESRPTLHRHAHWLWTTALGGEPSGGGASASGGSVRDLIVWVPDGVPSSLLAAMVGRRLTAPAWAPKGFVDAELALVGFGGLEVIEDLGGRLEADRWVSATPYLLTRHMKRNRDFRTLLAEDVNLELRYRFGPDAPHVRGVVVDEDRRTAALAFRQQRIGERRQGAQRATSVRSMSKRVFHQREALFLTIELDRPVPGPLLLGHLSHFGFGRFDPLP